MRVRTRVALAVALVVAVCVTIASVASRDRDRTRQSYRTRIELVASCRSPAIVVDDRTWRTEVAAPADWDGVVDGTLWISGHDAVFVGDDGASMRYTVAVEGDASTGSCGRG